MGSSIETMGIGVQCDAMQCDEMRFNAILLGCQSTRPSPRLVKSTVNLSYI